MGTADGKPTLLRRTAFVLAAAAVAVVLLRAAATLAGISASTQLGRLRAAISIGALALLFATFESIRRTHLKERYALLWVLPALAILLLAFFPGALDAVRRYFGMEWGSIMAGVAFLSLLAAVFAISRTLSRNENNIAAIAQLAARLETRVRTLEEAAGRPSPDGGAPAAAPDAARTPPAGGGAA